MLPDLSRSFAEQIRNIALEAGAAILAIACQPITVERKVDQSPVTAADHAANAAIVTTLQGLTPAIPVVSEEGEKTLPNPDAPFWLVDPLDGTKEFIAGNGEYTVNIALIVRREPVLGVVHAPSIDRTFFGFRGGAAYESRGAQAAPIRARNLGANTPVAVASRSHLDERTRAYLAERSVADIRQIGSSLKFCLIATGEADLYPRFGPTMEWDTAAGHAVLAAAGGTVTQTDGTPLRYAKPDFRNPDFIARGAA